MISPQEQADLDIMVAAITKEKISAFDIMREFLRMSPTALSHCGHKSVESALAYTMKSSEAKIAKLHAAYFRKYPD